MEIYNRILTHPNRSYAIQEKKIIKQVLLKESTYEVVGGPEAVAVGCMQSHEAKVKVSANGKGHPYKG